MTEIAYAPTNGATEIRSTLLGHVLSVRGSTVDVCLPQFLPSGGKRATVGKFLTITAGAASLIGMITEVSTKSGECTADGAHTAVASIDLMGEIVSTAGGGLGFRRGVSEYPAIGDEAAIVSNDILQLIFGRSGNRTVSIGHLDHDSSLPAYIDVDGLLAKHFAILGSTGAGKSSGLAVILNRILDARPHLRVLLLDGHNEYGHCFGDRASLVSAGSLKLPFWLFTFEEFTDVIYGGRPSVAEETEILAELIPIAKASYLRQRVVVERHALLKRKDVGPDVFTVDTPVPYLLQDLLSLIDERMGKLENRPSRMTHHRLMTRIAAIKNDPRYAFMFANANVGGDSMAGLLSQLFGLESDGRPVTILQLASFPVEVMDAVVCVLARLAFDFGLWSDGVMPLLLVCEEAHRYASADRSAGFGPTRHALSRIAKEGRKHGVHLGLVTQRPAELDPTIISQCSTLFAMRLANDQDQALLQSAVSDAAANLLAFVPSLGTGEAVCFGEGMPLPARLSFDSLPKERVPHSVSAAPRPDLLENGSMAEFIGSVVERWRRASSNPSPTAGDTQQETGEQVSRQQTGSSDSSMSPTAELAFSGTIDRARLQILKR